MKNTFKKIIDYFSNKYYLKRQADAEFNPIIFYSLKSKNLFMRGITSILPLWVRKRMSILMTSSRIVEEPFIFENINLGNAAKILDLGCCYSKVSSELASLGFKVTGTDLNDYNYSHPNFNFTKGDFLKNKFQDNYFDCVIAISVIEHFGLNCYGGPMIVDGDKKAAKEIYRILKEGGKLIITLPFGKKETMPAQRIYDTAGLEDLLRDFRIEKEEYYKYDKGFWLPAKKEVLVDTKFSEDVQGVVLALCQKQ